MQFERITVDPAQMGGVPCLRGLRIPVATVVDMVADGMSEAEILAAYPDLEADDIREALQYAEPNRSASPAYCRLGVERTAFSAWSMTSLISSSVYSPALSRTGANRSYGSFSQGLPTDRGASFMPYSLSFIIDPPR